MNIKAGKKMKPKNLNKQKGSFVIELAFVLMFLCLLTLFTADIAMQLFTRAKLDRVSYSLVNVLKERTRFYEGNNTLTQDNYDQLDIIAKKLLPDTNYNVLINSTVPTEAITPTVKPVKCSPIIINPALIPISSLTDVKFPVYQVTVCSAFNSWFGKFTHGKNTFVIQSTSVMPGR
jgi:tight adherence protein F